jgi:hypothetical protein
MYAYCEHLLNDKFGTIRFEMGASAATQALVNATGLRQHFTLPVAEWICRDITNNIIYEKRSRQFWEGCSLRA